MKKLAERKAEYFEYKELILIGEKCIPSKISNLPLAAQSRLNRLVISKGFILGWWDTHLDQEEQAANFVPIHSSDYSKINYPDNSVGGAAKKLRKTLDKKGILYYPDISVEEKEMQALLSLRCSLTKKLGYTENIRPLKRSERKVLMKLHGLKLNADSSLINTGIVT